MIEWIEEESQWLGQTPEALVVLQKEQSELSLGDKVLIISTVISVVGLAWQIYQWRQHREAST